MRRETRRALIPLCLLAVLALAPSAAQAAKNFKYGVASAEVRSSSAILWARANKSGPVVLEVQSLKQGREAKFRDCPVSATRRLHKVQTAAQVFAKAKRQFRRGHRKGTVALSRLEAKTSNDLTVQTKVKGLKPAVKYSYRFCRKTGGKSDVGHFRTAPSKKTKRTIHFAWSGDQDASPSPPTRTRGCAAGVAPAAHCDPATEPYWNNFGVLNQMRSEENDFNVLMGDWIYSDSEVPGVNQDAINVKQKWAKYRTNVGETALSKLRSVVPVYNHWDDHEFINDFSPHESAKDLGIPISTKQLYENGVRAFRDYAPTTYSKDKGIYRTVRWGKNLELFFLDERSFRSDAADSGGACDNPASGGVPDVAPTAPQDPTRDFFAALVPALSNPPPQKCLNNINNTKRTLLGSDQFARFKNDIKSSDATWKVVMNEVPIQQYYALPYDRWEGYEHERQRMLKFITDQVENTVFLTTDVHANLVNNARFQTLEPGGPKDSGLMDVTTGPIATKSFSQEIDDVGGPNAGQLVTDLFLLPQATGVSPPGGMGMECAADDTFSYGEVTVTGSKLTIDLKNIAGGPAAGGVGGTGTPCAQIVLNAE